MPRDPVLPTRRLRPSFTHQWAGTIPPQEEAAATRPISPLGHTRSTETMIPTTCRWACQQQARPYPGTSWAPALPTSRPTHLSWYPGLQSQLCQEHCTPKTNSLKWAQRPVGPAPRLREAALPASRHKPQNLRSSDSILQWVSSSPRAPRVLQPGPTKQQPAASTEGRAWQPTGLWANRAYQTTHIVSSPQQKDPHNSIEHTAWVMRGKWTVRMHRMSPMEGHFSKVEKCI